jgi:phosphate butyryltransferase
VSPDLGRKKDIVLNAVDVAHALGIECPRVAVVSYVEKVSYSNAQSVTDAAMLANMNRRGEIPGCVVEGPYAIDNVISKEAAALKGLDGKVAGGADVLLMHDIHVANVAYKLIQLWVRVPIAGAVVGSRVPMVVTSRLETIANKTYSLALGVLLMGLSPDPTAPESGKDRCT